MIKVPVIKWIDSLEKGNRMVVILLFAVSSLCGGIIFLFSQNNSLQNQKNALQEDKEKQIIQCEREKNEIVIKNAQVFIDYKTKVDSEKSDFLNARIKALEISNDSKDSTIRVVQRVTQSVNKKIDKIDKIIK